MQSPQQPDKFGQNFNRTDGTALAYNNEVVNFRAAAQELASVAELKQRNEKAMNAVAGHAINNPPVDAYSAETAAKVENSRDKHQVLVENIDLAGEVLSWARTQEQQEPSR